MSIVEHWRDRHPRHGDDADGQQHEQAREQRVAAEGEPREPAGERVGAEQRRQRGEAVREHPAGDDCVEAEDGARHEQTEEPGQRARAS